MRKVAIVTDSNSGITEDEAAKWDIHVLPMPFYIDGSLYLEGITLSQEEFYKQLEQDVDISTSQPAPGDIMDLWNELLTQYDEVVHIPMSSGLSASCETARMLAEEYDGKVQVVDNQRISVTLRDSAIDAALMADAGWSAERIRRQLEKEKLQASIYITLETLKYLKKGGRITPAAAAIGTVLNLKPVLQIQGEKLDAFNSRCRGKKQARKTMIHALQEDLEHRFSQYVKSGQMRVAIAYTGNLEEARDWKREVMEAFPDFDVYMAPLSLSVACHIGRGALAIGCVKEADLQ